MTSGQSERRSAVCSEETAGGKREATDCQAGRGQRRQEPPPRPQQGEQCLVQNVLNCEEFSLCWHKALDSSLEPAFTVVWLSPVRFCVLQVNSGKTVLQELGAEKSKMLSLEARLKAEQSARVQEVSSLRTKQQTAEQDHQKQTQQLQQKVQCVVKDFLSDGLLKRVIRK